MPSSMGNDKPNGSLWHLLVAMSACCLLSSAGTAHAANSVTVTSPDGKAAITIQLESKPRPFQPGLRAYYRVSYSGRTVLTDSPLGIQLSGAPPLDHDFEIAGTQRASHDHTWHWAYGAESTIRNHYNQATVSLRESVEPHRLLDVILRAYDTGVAFRYFLPKQPALGKFIISSEETGFDFAGPATGFALYLQPFQPNYEGEFWHITLDHVLPVTLICPPLTVHLQSGPWLALLEADRADFAGLYLSGARGIADGLRATLAPEPEQLGVTVVGKTPEATPWRVVLVSPQPGGLIESSEPMVLNLNPPSVIKDTSWIRPGKAVWSWWSGNYDRGVRFKPGMNTATMAHYTAFAARAHIRYNLVDGGWSPLNDITHPVPRVNIPAILQDAAQKHVKILLWDYWKTTKEQMDQAFPLYEKWGVAGVKVDFMQGVREDQANVELYKKIVATAAKYHLVIDIHGAMAPSGLRRTYPNILNREGIMGLEYDKWSYRQTPRHAVTIPFTRMLAGPMDYTPGCFNNATRAAFRPVNVHPMCQGTRANQLAMYVVYLAPLQMLADYPEDYLGQPGFEFLKKVPTVWDETKVLNGEPARYITIARRQGKDWYLGSMTNWQPRHLNVPLSFLGPGRYQAEIFADGPDAGQDAKSLSIRNTTVTAATSLELQLASGGGAAAIFTPIQ
jgi:alpha-glucosidase